MWAVHKFGGTSVADAERYRGVGQVLAQQVAVEGGARQAVVVSAMSGVTNALIELVNLASGRDEVYRARLEALEQKHVATISELVAGERRVALLEKVREDFSNIADILHALWLLRGQSAAAVELISGYGELWSAQILAESLLAAGRKADWLDAREVLVVRTGESGVVVDWEVSEARLAAWLKSRSGADVVVITGFVASTMDGVPTTLGRNGSDYSASIFGACLRAESITIWTDVDGVLSADPRQVPGAQVLAELSYREAMELAYFGAKIVHPSTMVPAVKHGIPVLIRNTFRPEMPGTRIHLNGSTESTIKGFATIDGMALVNVEGTGMIGVPGIASRLFGALREAHVSVVMISQGSSEHSICFAIPRGQIEAAQEVVRKAFYAELHLGQIQTVDVEDDCSILAVVGDQMAGIPGVAAKFFGALGKANVNIRAIAQGSSERNISAVIKSRDTTRALRAVHAGFYLSNQTISIGLIGPGNVGATLLAQLHEEIARLREEFRIDLRVRAIATSEAMILEESQIALDAWREAFATQARPFDLEAFVAHVHADYLPHAVLVDCTSDDAIAAQYAGWLERGIHVVTPNKKANSGAFSVYDELQQLSRSMRRHYLYETTVGAGLPIIQTLKDLIQTGDEILSIEGILSGTLSYLFNVYDGSRPFSDIVKDARAMGFTEPDPRDDLSGTDVARKLVILAREMGLKIELSDVEVESLVPEALRSGSVDAYLADLPAYDAHMLERFEAARRRGEVLRFVGRVDAQGKASVRLRAYAADHAFARIRRTDNIVEFRTRRYNENPLIVQGPGAGPEVTAGGIFGDILRLAAYLGATL